MIEIYFEIIFLFKAGEKVVAERYERDLDMLFQFKRLNNLLQSTARKILTWFSTLW